MVTQASSQYWAPYEETAGSQTELAGKLSVAKPSTAIELPAGEMTKSACLVSPSPSPVDTWMSNEGALLTETVRCVSTGVRLFSPHAARRTVITAVAMML